MHETLLTTPVERLAAREPVRVRASTPVLEVVHSMRAAGQGAVKLDRMHPRYAETGVDPVRDKALAQIVRYGERHGSGRHGEGPASKERGPGIVDAAGPERQAEWVQRLSRISGAVEQCSPPPPSATLS